MGLTELDPSQDPFAREAIEHLVKRYGSPLFIIDAARVRTQYRKLAAALPNVDLHYALKPLPHSSVVQTLRDEGAFFDLATNGEVDLVQRCGVAAERCIHTHPIKRDSDIRTALDYGVNVFVVDNPDELRKFVKFRGRASLLIRVSFRSPDAVCDLSRKFGCAPDAAAELLALSILDIGGGFPVDYVNRPISVDDFCAPIRRALSALPPGVRVIAEPGRYIAAPSAISVSSVMGRALREGAWWYYLDDGLYGSYSGQMYDHAKYPIEALSSGDGQTHPSVLAGPTCDSIDVIGENLHLPKLEIGDLIVGRSMGAYTSASASDFNFFPRATVLALDEGRLLNDRRLQ
jgi:ornithine decarboxylase